MIILGIDPGPETSGVVYYDAKDRIVLTSRGDMPNGELLDVLRSDKAANIVACECIEAMYAHVGKETVRTIRFTGRIEEAAESQNLRIVMLSPQEIKKAVCGTASAKDPAVRQALIDQLGPPGTKKNPGPTHGVSKHAWRALAAAYAVAKSLI